MKKEESWPIHPRFLSMLDEEGEMKKEYNNSEDYDPNNKGIYRSSTVRGFITDASDDNQIKNPLALFQLAPSNFVENENTRIMSNYVTNSYLKDIMGDRQLIRIDPSSLAKSITCCEGFRNYYTCDKHKEVCGKTHCFGLDSRVLVLYHLHLEDYYFRKEFDKYLKALEEICTEFNKSIDNPDEYGLKVVVFEDKKETGKEKRKIYLYYRCKYSMLYEYFFPVFNSGRIVAVLMLGQRLGDDMTKEDVFRDFREGGKHRDRLVCDKKSEERDEILKKFDLSVEESLKKIDRPISNANSSRGKNELPEDIRDAIYRRIKILENNIKKEVVDASRQYVAEHFLRIETDLRAKLNTALKAIDSESIDIFKGILNNALEDICTTFRINEFIRLYSSKTKVEQTNKKYTTFELIGCSNPDSDEIEMFEFEKELLKNYHHLDIDWKKSMGGCSEEAEKEKENYRNREMLTNALSSELRNQIDSTDTFSVEPHIVGDTKIIIWKRYDKDLKDKYYVQYNDIYIKHLKSIYHVFWEPFNLIKSINFETQLETVMRVSNHEASQIIPTIVDALEREYSIDHYALMTRGNYSQDDSKWRDRTINDCILRLGLLDGLYKRSSLIFKDKEPKREWCDLHRTIYAVRTLLDEKAQEDKFQRIIIVDDNEILRRHQLFTNELFLHQILFNLLDNAIKYGVRGSNIYIKVDPQYTRNNIESIDISVINYGDEIKEEDCDKIFNLYYRSMNTAKSTEGIGIGLFLVRKLSTLLGYVAEDPSSKVIVGYNLPLHYYASKQNMRDQYNINDNYWVKHLDSNLVNEIVNTHRNIKWKIGRSEFFYNNSKKIYKTVFKVTLTKERSSNSFIKYQG